MRELLSEETFDPFSVGAVGLCPYADITVLRCADPNIIGGKHYRHMLFGLEYCVDLHLDVLYIGLAYKGDRHPTAVSNLLDLLEKNGTVVFAPAGNYERPNPSGLAFPASVNSVHAVTSVVRDSNSADLKFCDYSALADKALHEKVSFCAYGGDAQSRVISTSNNLGFLGDSGTSVAAAIAAACYANAVSSIFVRRITHEYDTLFPSVGQVSSDHVEHEVRKWSLPSSDRDALMQVMQRSAKPVSGLTTEQCGSGLVKVPSKDVLP